MTVDLHYASLCDVAVRIASGNLDSVGVTGHLVARIERLEPHVHAFTEVTAERAQQEARAADVARDRGEELGPLHGVPIAIKDLCMMRGTATTGGHSFRKNLIDESNATVVQRLQDSGAIILGKLATTEGAMAGYHPDFEIPRNPWATDRWPGVSSSGPGVATAAGLCFGSLGTDTGGSIRYPSSANGIVGLKPTWGRVSRSGVLDLAPTLDHVGPMARTVRDTARMLSVISGYDDDDPTTLRSADVDFEAALDQGVVGLRIGWDEKYAGRAAPHVFKAVRSVVEELSDAGTEIVEVAVPTVDETVAWRTIASAEAAVVHQETFPSRVSDYGENFRGLLTKAHKITAVERADAYLARERAVKRMMPVFEHIDLLVCPTVAAETFRYDSNDAYGGLDEARGTSCGIPLEWYEASECFTKIWNYNGYPTLCLPCGSSDDGMPLSVQFAGPPLSEGILCRAGHVFEQATNWHMKHPEVEGEEESNAR